MSVVQQPDVAKSVDRHAGKDSVRRGNSAAPNEGNCNKSIYRLEGGLYNEKCAARQLFEIHRWHAVGV